MVDNKFCINCKHFRKNPEPTLSEKPEFSKCANTATRDPVTGAETMAFCSVERSGYGSGICSKAGTFFKSKEVSHD